MADFKGCAGDKALSTIGKLISFGERDWSEETRITKKAICCRVLFAIHGFLAIWRVSNVLEMKVLYALFVPVSLFPL